MRTVDVGGPDHDYRKLPLLIGSPNRILSGYFCVTIEIAARLDGCCFIRVVRRIPSIDSYAAEVDESLSTGMARNIENVLRALNVDSKEFIPASGLPDQGEDLREEIVQVAAVADLLADLVGPLPELGVGARPQARLQAVVLTLMPLAFAAVLSLMDPGYVPNLFGSPLGKAILVAVSVLLAMGWLVIRKILSDRP